MCTSVCEYINIPKRVLVSVCVPPCVCVCVRTGHTDTVLIGLILIMLRCAARQIDSVQADASRPKDRETEWMEHCVQGGWAGQTQDPQNK